MVREVKFSCDGSRFEMPVCRDSVLDDEPALERPPAKRRKRKPVPTTVPAGSATPRRHLAGADWLSDYVPRVGKVK